MPRGCSASASARVPTGSEVLMSMTIDPRQHRSHAFTAVAKYDLTHYFVIGQHRDDGIRALPDLPERFRSLAAMLPDEDLDRFRADVVHRDVEPRLDQMSGHGVAHISNTDKTHLPNWFHAESRDGVPWKEGATNDRVPTESKDEGGRIP